MNIKHIIDAMSDEEKQTAYSYLWNWQKKKDEEAAKDIVLTENEKFLALNNRIVDCIKTIRDRVNCSLSIAKAAMEDYFLSVRQ